MPWKSPNSDHRRRCQRHQSNYLSKPNAARLDGVKSRRCIRCRGRIDQRRRKRSRKFRRQIITPKWCATGSFKFALMRKHRHFRYWSKRQNDLVNITAGAKKCLVSKHRLLRSFGFLIQLREWIPGWLGIHHQAPENQLYGRVERDVQSEAKANV